MMRCRLCGGGRYDQEECREWLESKSWTVVIHGASWDTYKHLTDDYEFIAYLFRDMDMIVVRDSTDQQFCGYWLSECEIWNGGIWHDNVEVVPNLWAED